MFPCFRVSESAKFGFGQRRRDVPLIVDQSCIAGTLQEISMSVTYLAANIRAAEEALDRIEC